MGRKIAREETMKLLFQMEMNNDCSDNLVELYINENNLDHDEQEYMRHAVRTIMTNLNNIDKSIEKYIKGWKIHRLAKVDLSVLRIAVYEIVYRKDIPIEVSINEAIEICKKYSTDESSKFINGVLGSFVREKDE
ncbi:transcription antitermination factor NusB [Anaerosalibacter massiliensis]|uniref:Transcription antitermination protein NusB n=1 Tax=Anaerosalibacter massiliensis TaxID=1347392 RepID=A0A9X2MEG2_9FIRM|nr:transcription antitermination factor NusB [Anaerosalibacter massiliensis]MCR2042603.1 transcription antitermination factor NusB [Anaerosalibacter massiliensis]